ncbi:MAG: D-alanyl-D-alanine carboxypeptidase [Clostridia bacterium]|nr:D-alanyl-D-alanine carboxypeptidase [Clostridia bacterium]
MKKIALRCTALFLSLLFLILPVSALSSQEAVPAAVELTLPCKSAVLIEQTTGEILYEKNPDERLPIASVTKIMTLLLTMEALKTGTVSIDENVPISEVAASMGGSQAYLEHGEVISMRDVLKAVFVSSANDGAVALAEMISGNVDSFVAAMNEKAAALGMHDTIFYNPTGLDDGETNLSTARDVAVMSKALLAFDDIYEYTKIWIDSIRGGAFGLSNTNKLIRFYPGATGLKTGSTAKAKYCVSASAERNGLKLCAVVLAGESSADRFQAAKTLLDHGFASYAFCQPEVPQLGEIRIWGGTQDRIIPKAQNSGFLLPKSEANGLEVKIELPSELQAPVEAGQALGKILYQKEGGVLREEVITAETSIPALVFGDILRRMFALFFTGQYG